MGRPHGETGDPRDRTHAGGDEMVLRAYVRAQAWWAGLAEEHGATAIEYALMLALIAMVIIGAVMFLGRATSSRLGDVPFPP
jgi:Flp pilus assembly pilin Flp